MNLNFDSNFINQSFDLIHKKENFDFDKIYTFNRNENEKIIIKRFKAIQSNSSVDLYTEINNQKYGFEVSKIPKYYNLYLGLILNDDNKNNENIKLKFFIKVIDTYGKIVHNTESNNILNLKGINFKFYLPSSVEDDEVSLYFKEGDNSSFKNKLNYNEELKCYETNYKGYFGEFEIKGYNYKKDKNIKEKIINEVVENKDTIEEKSDLTESNTIWIICGSILGGILLIFLIYMVYYFFSSSKDNGYPSLEEYQSAPEVRYLYGYNIPETQRFATTPRFNTPRKFNPFNRN
jgi:hypothetical protein